MAITKCTYEEYVKETGVRVSTLKEFLISNKRGIWKMMKPQEDTPATIKGRALHCLVLEGKEEYKKRFKVRPMKPDGKVWPINSTVYKEWFAQQQPGITQLKHAEANHVHKMARAIAANPLAMNILKHNPNRETMFTWVDPDTGVNCKALVDAYGRNIMDLKTIRKTLTDKNISRELGPEEYGGRDYYMQFAYYYDGAKANGLNFDKFIALFVQNQDEYDCRPIEVNYNTLDYGREYYKKALKAYKAAQSGDNSGISDKLDLLDMPEYVIQDDFDLMAGFDDDGIEEIVYD